MYYFPENLLSVNYNLCLIGIFFASGFFKPTLLPGFFLYLSPFGGGRGWKDFL
jgi:hypothetical protein